MKGGGRRSPGGPDDSEERRWRSGSEPGDGGRRQPEGRALFCELCGGPVLDRHCKIVCLNCGYQRDCSDP